MPQTPEQQRLVKRAMDDFEEARHDHHDDFCKLVEERYDAYRGFLDLKSKASEWRSHLHPSYAYQIIETIVSNLVDDGTIFRAKPRPLIDSREAVDIQVSGAEAIELLLRYEMDLDRFQRKQRPYTLQASIAGLSPAAVFWDYQEGVRPRLREEMRSIHGPDGAVIGQVPVMVEASMKEIHRDGPTFHPFDVRDFLWPDGAEDVQTARYIIRRIWLTMDDLRQLEADGVYENVEELAETKSHADERDYRSDDLFERKKKRGYVEILEWWGPDNDVIVVGNRSVLLQHETNPYWHAMRPFVVASGSPQPFDLQGVSDVELVADLQMGLWEVMNQRLDNLALINNAIVLIRASLDDQDLRFAPGEFWEVEDPSEAQLWTPNAQPAEVSMGAEAAIKGDLQNITGGMPFMSGVDSQTIDQKTATGASIVTTLAQRRLKSKKQNFSWAYEDAGNMMISLLQQYVREDRIVPKIGARGASNFMRIKPTEIQMRCTCDIEAIDESLMRQEKRAEAQALATIGLQYAPFAAAEGEPISAAELFKDLLRAFDKQDLERYFLQKTQPHPGGHMAVQNGGQNPGNPQPATSGGQGVTAPSAADVTSPSNETSQSAARFMQQLLAARGGGRNA